MPGRQFNANGYRYGFNGQEKDDDVFNGAYTAEYWEYDSRLGRRWNLDQVVKHWESSYACFKGNPIYYSDPSGLDGEGTNGECIDDPSTSGSVTPPNGNGSSDDENNPKGRILLDFEPIKWKQIGGNQKYVLQNNLYNSNFEGEWAPSESDSYSKALFTLGSKQIGKKTTLNFAIGAGLTRKKGGVDMGFPGDGTPHFGSGMGTIGPAANLEAETRVYRGFFFSLSADLSGGLSFSDFGKGSGKGMIDISFLNSEYQGWSNRGVGATAGLNAGITITPKLFKSSWTDVVRVNMSVLYMAHAFRISPFTYDNGTYFSAKTGVFGGTQGTLVPNLTITLDLN